MRTNYLTTVVLLLIGACAKTEPPLENKNTNWLRECESDSDCGNALACLRGICTVECDDDEACEVPGGGAQCDEGVCAAIGVDAQVSMGEGGEPSGDASTDRPCIVLGGVCAEIVAQGQGEIQALAVRDDRVYWLDDRQPDPNLASKDGAFESARFDGSNRVTLATGVDFPRELSVDAKHAYFKLETDIAASPFDRIVRVPLEGGDLELLVSEIELLVTLKIDETYAYWVGNHDVGFASKPEAPDQWDYTANIYRLPKSGAPGPSFVALPEHILYGSFDADSRAFAIANDTVYWSEGSTIRAFDITTREARDVFTHDLGASIQSLVVSGDELIWAWGNPGFTNGSVSRLDLTRTDASVVNSDPFEGAGAMELLVDERSIYCTHQIEAPWAVRRIDRATGEIVVVAESPELSWVKMAISDEYLFLSVNQLSATGMPQGLTTGYVVRLPREM